MHFLHGGRASLGLSYLGQWPLLFPSHAPTVSDDYSPRMYVVFTVNYVFMLLLVFCELMQRWKGLKNRYCQILTLNCSNINSTSHPKFLSAFSTALFHSLVSRGCIYANTTIATSPTFAQPQKVIWLCTNFIAVYFRDHNLRTGVY